MPYIKIFTNLMTLLEPNLQRVLLNIALPLFFVADDAALAAAIRF